MKKILRLALPVLLVAACGDASDSSPENADAAPDVGQADTDPSSPDLPAKLDVYIAPTHDAPSDVPFSPDLPTMPVDGPAGELDAPGLPDGPRIDIYWDVPPAQPVDGPASPTDATTRTLYSPDGRTWMVIMVDACQSGGQPDTTRCPATYDEGLAKVRAVDGGRSFTETRAGRCSEGSYVYFPYFATSSTACYYDASAQQLIASAYHNDTISECGLGDGTASFTLAYGAYSPCTKITWEARSQL
jgi:hypothetical protein